MSTQISLKKIAETLLNRRNHLCSDNVEADIRKNLTHSELSEAMRRGWVYPSEEWGSLVVSNLPRHMEEIKVAAESQEAVTESFTPAKPSPGRDFFVGLFEAKNQTYRLYEDVDYQVGAKVTVAQNGKSFEGVVAEKGNDGKYKVSFGENKPPQDRPYSSTEMTAVAPNAATTPTTPAVTPKADTGFPVAKSNTMPAVAGV